MPMSLLEFQQTRPDEYKRLIDEIRHQWVAVANELCNLIQTESLRATVMKKRDKYHRQETEEGTSKAEEFMRAISKQRYGIKVGLLKDALAKLDGLGVVASALPSDSRLADPILAARTYSEEVIRLADQIGHTDFNVRGIVILESLSTCGLDCAARWIENHQACKDWDKFDTKDVHDVENRIEGILRHSKKKGILIDDVRGSKTTWNLAIRVLGNGPHNLCDGENSFLVFVFHEDKLQHRIGLSFEEFVVRNKPLRYYLLQGDILRYGSEPRDKSEKPARNEVAQQYLGDFLNNRLPLRSKIVEELGDGTPANWELVFTALASKPIFQERATNQVRSSIRNNHVTAPRQAEAFLERFCQWSHSTVENFLSALDEAGLERLASAIRTEAGIALPVARKEPAAATLPPPKASVWIAFNLDSVEQFRKEQVTILQTISGLLRIPSSEIQVGLVIKVNPLFVELILAAFCVPHLVDLVSNRRVPNAMSASRDPPPQAAGPVPHQVLPVQVLAKPAPATLDYSNPATIELNELFHTKETVTGVYVEALIAAKHLFGPQSLSSYLERKLNNAALPAFDLATEVKRESGASNAIVVVAGILPGDIDAFGAANRWEKLPWQHGAGEWSLQSSANSWKPSWYKFFSRRDKIMYFVLAVWPGEDVVAHYALTVCCKYPSLAESIRVWRYPVAEEQAFIRTQLEESTRAHVAGAVVVLGESDEIGKWLSQHFGLVAAAVNSTWYRLNTYTNRHGHRVVLMQVMHPYWGSVAGALASRLFSYGCVELVHCGNVGRLMPTVETSLTIVSAPHRACHVTSLQSIKIKNPLLKWLRDNPPAVKLFPDHVHISIASPVLETKEMIEQWAACSTIDVEVFSLAKAAAEAKRPLSCLHYVSDVVGSTHSLGDKWEDSLKSGAPQARHAMIVSVSTYLSQLGKK